MNALTTLNTTNATLTMSSREIAELTGKEHKNVLADARKMLAELGYDSAEFSAQYIDPTGRALPCFNLPKDLTITLVSGYNVQMRYAITKRWMELEAQQAPKLPTTFAEALRLAAELEEQKETLRLQNEAMKPAATVGMAVSARKQTTIMDFARKLPGVNTMQVQNKLAELGHMRKRKNAWAVYAASKKYFTEGFDHKGFSIITLTEKGMELVSRLYLRGELQMLKGQSPVSAEELEDILNA